MKFFAQIKFQWKSKKQELQEISKFPIEMFWNIEARNLKLDLFHI